MVLFKAARVKDQWCQAAPSRYMIKATESGYINADVFADYGKHCHLPQRKEPMETRPKTPGAVGPPQKPPV